MEIVYRKKFKKTFKKQSQKIHNKFFERLEVFKDDPFHYSLNNHALGGEFKGIRSFDITGDIRVHYTETDGVAVFLMICSHSELY